MEVQLTLSENEWQLLASLLETESRELRIELRRCDTQSGQESVRRRVEIVERLLAQLLQANPPAPVLG